MSDTETYRAAAKQFLVEHCFLEEDELAPDTPLFSSRLISSADLIDLVLFLEETLGTRIDPMEIRPEDLDSIELIAGFCTARANT